MLNAISIILLTTLIFINALFNSFKAIPFVISLVVLFYCYLAFTIVTLNSVHWVYFIGLCIILTLTKKAIHSIKSKTEVD